MIKLNLPTDPTPTTFSTQQLLAKAEGVERGAIYVDQYRNWCVLADGRYGEPETLISQTNGILLATTSGWSIGKPDSAWAPAPSPTSITITQP
jgi:hypothetical protein